MMAPQFGQGSLISLVRNRSRIIKMGMTRPAKISGTPKINPLLVPPLTVGGGTSSGFIFGVPLILAGLVIPIFMMRDLFRTSEIKEPCPNCGAIIKTSDATLQLRCPSCHKVINVREEKLFLAEE